MSVGSDDVLGAALQHVQVSSHCLHLVGEVEISQVPGTLSTQRRNLYKGDDVVRICSKSAGEKL